MHIDPYVLIFLAVCAGLGWLARQVQGRVPMVPSVVWIMLFGLVWNVTVSFLPFEGAHHFVELIRGSHPSEAIAFAFSVATMVILFIVGLEGSIPKLLEAAKIGFPVAVTGVVMPMCLIGGFSYFVLGYGFPASFAAAGVASATSVAISASVLESKGIRRTAIGAVVIAAAVIDDILGLGVLQAAAQVGSVNGHSAHGGSIPWGAIITGSIFVGMILAANTWGRVFFKMIRAWDESVRELALMFWLFIFAGTALMAGIEPILGAYVAGLTFDEAFLMEPGEEADYTQERAVEHFFQQLERMLLPVFFIIAMCMIDPRILLDLRVLLIGAALSVLAIIGKLFAGLPVPQAKLIVGTAMVPRGEVGIIFASVCLSSGIITGELFGALMVMILVSTLLGALLLGPIIGWSSFQKEPLAS